MMIVDVRATKYLLIDRCVVHFARDVRIECAMTRSIVEHQRFGGFATVMQIKVSSFIRSHSSLMRTLAVLSFVSAGCSSEPCPEGTVEDGEVCRRIPKMTRTSSTGTAGSADMEDEDLTDEDLDNPQATGKPSSAGKSGGGAGGSSGATATASEEESDDAEASAGSSGSSAGRGGGGGSGGSSSKAGAGGGGSGGSKSAAGAGGAAGKAGASDAGAGAKAGSGGAGAGGAAGAAAGAGGSAGASAGAGGASAGAGGAGAGAGGAAGAAGGGAGADGGAMLPTGDWFCINVGSSCSCIAGDGVDSDTCVTPKPKCCFTITSEDTPNCQCWPENSAECTQGGTRADAEKVEACPP
jgi:hypothetical protein